MVTSIVYGYLSMSVSVEQEKEIKSPNRSFIVSIVVVTAIVAVIGYLTAITPNFSWKDGLLLAVILFICGFIPSYYIYRLRQKKEEDADDE